MMIQYSTRVECCASQLGVIVSDSVFGSTDARLNRTCGAFRHARLHTRWGSGMVQHQWISLILVVSCRTSGSSISLVQSRSYIQSMILDLNLMHGSLPYRSGHCSDSSIGCSRQQIMYNFQALALEIQPRTSLQFDSFGDIRRMEV